MDDLGKLFSLDSDEMIHKIILIIPSWKLKNIFNHNDIFELREETWWPNHSDNFIKWQRYLTEYNSTENQYNLRFLAEKLAISNKIYFHMFILYQ